MHITQEPKKLLYRHLFIGLIEILQGLLCLEKQQNRLGSFLQCLGKNIAVESTIALAKTVQETELSRINESVALETHERDCRAEEVRDIDRQISEKSGPEYIKLLADLEAERGNIRVAEQTIGRLKKEKDSNLSAMNDIFIDMKKFENSIADKNKDFRQLQIDRANLAMEYESQKKVLDQVKEAIK